MGTNNLAAAALLTALVPFALANPNPNPQFGSVADSIRASMTADLPSFISEFNNADNFPTLSGFSEATNAVSSTVSVTTDQGGSPYLGAVSSLFSGGIIYPEDSEFGSATGAAGSSASELIGGLSSSLDSPKGSSTQQKTVKPDGADKPDGEGKGGTLKEAAMKNVTMLGDPVSLKAETSEHSPKPEEDGARERLKSKI
ncbi:hypothetical protein GJ744_011699 [Endocarpon pusillum]|uniref:Uncharacterized protein n=1 Tax=Endocarpon pusillum TaxID=364733 RepID=A0A8H7AFF2_9EURO|nr:hypothetical protein GJ744_011699 [Endocarpon pusillum]